MKSFASLTQITVFVRIAELGSLSAAGRELELSPSAISKNLSQLEEHLGVLLVKRTTRSLTLTDSGRVIFERASGILADLETTLDAARHSKNLQGNLRLTCSMAFGAKQLTPVLGRYLDAHSEVSASISLDDRLTNLVEENFDVAVRITSRTDSSYAARKLATIHWVYCAAPGYLDANESIHKPADIRRHRCLTHPAMTTEGAWTFRGKNDSQTVTIRSVLDSNSSLALHEAALQGKGVACLPTYVVASDILKGALQIVLPEYCPAETHTLYAMYYRTKYANALVRSFIDFVVDDIGRIPPWDRELGEVVDFSVSDCPA
ncbi:LysR family transcriptional regulator [Paraburkholderia sp. JHI869]|uniref:LysR family transcriptional regulator n=1 Tax=Paraburkholderia sp. JHI869 TaxID=3112959 RepID=UPI00316BDA52